MTEVTRILSIIEQGDPHAAEQLLPLVYDELRRLAAQTLVLENPGQTLETTASVHEAYRRLLGEEQVQQWDSRRHFIAARRRGDANARPRTRSQRRVPS
jgi:hypothetical protein